MANLGANDYKLLHNTTTMTSQQYRTQFENQVKDLIRQYAETHGHAPDVTIKWGSSPDKWEKLNTEMDGALEKATDEDWDKISTPAPEVVPEEWNPASQPPDSQRDVRVKLSDERELKGWYADWKWRIIYLFSKDKDAGEPLRPGHTVVGWKEIE